MPAYDPREVAQLASAPETRWAAGSVFDSLDRFPEGIGVEVVWDILQRLVSPDCRFYKTVSSKYDRDELLDVYHVSVTGVDFVIYLKLKIAAKPRGTLSRVVTVLSFKEK